MDYANKMHRRQMNNRTITIIAHATTSFIIKHRGSNHNYYYNNLKIKIYVDGSRAVYSYQEFNHRKNMRIPQFHYPEQDPKHQRPELIHVSPLAN